MRLALITISIYISYIDLKSHRITNRSLLCALLLLFALALMQDAPVYPESAIFVTLISPALVKLRVGAGDIKLLILFSLFFLPPTLEISIRFLSALSVIAIFLIVFTLFKEKTLRSSIALAPAICGAVIWSAS